MIRHRNRTGSRASVAVIDDANDVVAPYALGNGAPEIDGLEPAAFVIRYRRGRNLVEEYRLPIERRPGIHHGMRHLRRQPVVDIRIQPVEDVEFAAPETQQLEFAILLDLKPDGIEIRQWTPTRIVLPIVRIAAQQDIGAGLVFTQLERTQHGGILVR